MLKYSLAMGIRVLCIIAALFVRGWWLIIPALGAVLLPYFAVVIANVGSKNDSTVLRPGGLVRAQSPDSVPGYEWSAEGDPAGFSQADAGGVGGVNENDTRTTNGSTANETRAANGEDDQPEPGWAS